jgi:hypothetical protein
MQSHSEFISLQWGFTHQQNIAAAGRMEAGSSPLDLHAVRQDSTGLPVAGWVADAVLSSRFKPENDETDSI